MQIRFHSTKGQYQELLSLLKTKESSLVSPAANEIQAVIPSRPTLAHASSMSGITLQNNPICLSTSHTHTSHSKHVPWIIDTGAADHMICNTSFFTKITSKVSYAVKLPNGAVTPVTHVGIVQITDSLVLHDVLCALAFTFNLISAKRLSDQLHCCLIFLSELCFIQALSTWTTIGRGKVVNGLYHLEEDPILPNDLVTCLSNFLPSKLSFSPFSASVLSTNHDFDLWHYRLGHISDVR